MAARVLNLWVSIKNSATARLEVGSWAEDYVADVIQDEGMLRRRSCYKWGASRLIMIVMRDLA